MMIQEYSDGDIAGTKAIEYTQSASELNLFNEEGLTEGVTNKHDI